MDILREGLTIFSELILHWPLTSDMPMSMNSGNLFLSDVPLAPYLHNKQMSVEVINL